MPVASCPVCQGKLSAQLCNWHLVCHGCGYECSDLKPSINSASSHRLIDEDARESGLKELRMKNFETLLLEIKRLKPTGGKLLDVGCAHGWFLETARRDFDVTGLEPDQDIFNQTRKLELNIHRGFFPEDLNEEDRFDVIVFNDVIEHIPEIERILRECSNHLEDEGLLVLNLPSSDGVLYRASKLLYRLGYPGFFERMWQKGLPSPHIHYFNAENLARLLRDHGFDEQSKGRLASLGVSGLATRLSYTGNLGFLTRIALYLCFLLALPGLRVLPADIIFAISKKAPSF